MAWDRETPTGHLMPGSIGLQKKATLGCCYILSDLQPCSKAESCRISLASRDPIRNIKEGR